MKIKAVHVIGDTSMEAHLFIKIIVRFLLIPHSQFILSSLHQSCISLLEYIFSVSFFFLICYDSTFLTAILRCKFMFFIFFIFWENLKHFLKSSICYWCYFSILLWAWVSRSCMRAWPHLWWFCDSLIETALLQSNWEYLGTPASLDLSFGNRYWFSCLWV